MRRTIRRCTTGSRCMLAWARVQGAGTTEEIANGLARAAKLEPKDVALHSWALFAGGMVALRTHPVQEILDQFVDMPDNPVAVPWQLRFQLAWRGTVRAFTGLQRGAIADLENVLIHREEEGALEAARAAFPRPARMGALAQRRLEPRPAQLRSRRSTSAATTSRRRPLRFGR